MGSEPMQPKPLLQRNYYTPPISSSSSSSSMATTPYDGGINLTDRCADCLTSCYPDDPFCNPFPSPPPLIPVTTNLSLHPKSHLLETLLIAAAAVLAASFILLLATYFIHRLRRRRRRRLLSILSTDSLPGAAGAAVEHHVWNIRTVGLEESLIRSIATTVYSAKDGLVAGGADCAVCLGELRDGEILRLLPKCEHAFHVPCIDRWLRSHLTCPLCRAPIVDSDDHPAPAIAGGLVGSSSSTTDETEASENGGLQLQVVVEPTVASSSSEQAELAVLQPVRRSVSMDAASLAVLLLRAEVEEKPVDEMKEVTKNRGRQVGNGKGVERSMSNRSGRFFLSRHRRWNSVLPL